MKKVLGKFIFMLIFVSLFFFTTTAFAEDNGDTLELEAPVAPLTTEERAYLINVSGFTESHVDALHPNTGREVIEGEGVVVSSGEVSSPMERPEYSILPLGTIPDSDVTMLYNVVKINTSDLSGYKKYYAISQFQWNKQPVNYFVDKMSVGFPSAMGVYFKTTAAGKIDLHTHQYYIYNSSTGTKTYSAQKTSPVNWDPALGVTGSYDLLAQGSGTINRFHGGTLTQYFYVKNDKVGTNFNMKFEYAHARTNINVGVTFPNSGISLSPGLTVDVMNKAASLLVQ